MAAKTKKVIKHIAKPKKRGGQVKYSSAMVQKAALLAEDGRSDARIAEGLKIGLSTLHKYKKDHKAVANAILRGRKNYVESEVEPALLSQAVPHDEVVEYFELRGKKGKKKTMTKVGLKVTKDKVNVIAAERVLKAHMADMYGDKVEHHGEIIVKHVVFGKPDGG